MPPQGARPQEQTLTDDQKSKVADVLSQFENSSLTESDAQTIVQQMQELGISPGSGLAEAFAEAGFDARDIGDKAGVGQAGGPGASGPPPPPPPSGRDTVDEGVVSLVSEALDAFNSSEDENVSLAEMLQARLEQSGYDTTASIVDFYA